MSGALELLTHVFGEQQGFVASFSGLRGFPKSNNLDATRSAYFRYPDERRRAEDWFRDEGEKGREVYICAHLLTARRRVKGNAAPLSALYVDGDGAKPGPSVPSPTATVQSSPGCEQFYWRLTRPVTPEVGEQLNHRLALAMGADESGWDLTQLLRPPGTHNHKYEDTPLVVLRQITDVTHDPDEFDRVLPPLPLEQLRDVVGCSRRPERVGPAPDLSRLSPRIQDLIRYGNRGEYECRSRADMAVCLAMFRAGYTEAEVWATMTDPTNRISVKFFEKGRQGEQYLALTIGKAEAHILASPRLRQGKVYARRKGVISLG